MARRSAARRRSGRQWCFHLSPHSPETVGRSSRKGSVPTEIRVNWLLGSSTCAFKWRAVSSVLTGSKGKDANCFGTLSDWKTSNYQLASMRYTSRSGSLSTKRSCRPHFPPQSFHANNCKAKERHGRTTVRHATTGRRKGEDSRPAGSWILSGETPCHECGVKAVAALWGFMGVRTSR